MAEKAYTIRNRHIGSHDLALIRGVLREHWSEGRTAISKILCEQWGWRQANGRLKDRACRVMLLVLESRGEVSLPPLLLRVSRTGKRVTHGNFSYDASELTGRVSEFSSLTVRMVRRSPDEGLWNLLLDRYHYLGCPWIVGSYLKYLAYLDGHLVACLGWGSAAWKVACRDRWIGWDRATRESNLHKVVNNVRFLILPWIRVEHLASRLLALNIRSLSQDWQRFYCHPINLLETFVDTTRFKGTCYKASNWIQAGFTKGRGKYDQRHRCSAPVKAVYLYPLSRDFREALDA